MHETVVSLQDWGNFYVVVGSSAAALTGLQFVVLTLVAQISPLGGGKETIAAFGSPNVVHFCAALLVASILSAPWHTMGQVGGLVLACGVAGLGYSAAVLKRALRQRGYRPVLEDWIWHTILPTVAYATILVAGAAIGRHAHDALFWVGGAELLLVFIGIHNSWDTVTYVTLAHVERSRAQIEPGQQPPPGPASD